MKRIAILYREIRDNGPLTCKELVEKVNRSVDLDLQICKSTIEKDLFKMRMDFDIELNSSSKGYTLAEEVDFVDRVVQYFNIQV